MLVLGCGGAGRAVALTFAAEGASAVWLANRGEERLQAVASDLRAAAYPGEVRALPPEPAAWASAAREAALVVQCTSVGLQPGTPPLLTAAAFRPGQCVYDLVYTARRTPILFEAAKAGARVANGLGMLLHQGAASFRIWTGRSADLAAMRSTLAASLAAGWPPGKSPGESPPKKTIEI